ncbi:MAG: twin-arginine translocase TatA/TatE family subunit [Gammaproteobacteria bacterium]|nr:twin-arginine translocase TatA/TatE family subunit [Gammaproteobacteria bacterium]|tara:strand:+ start:8826 stop:8990 length:165 start_codon:yes stop_codon:yes gene_type:complete
MGLGGISIWQLLIVLIIILLLVGPKRLKSLGSEMGNFLKNFRKAVDDKQEDKKE